jgi:hypothetical protein
MEAIVAGQRAILSCVAGIALLAGVGLGPAVRASKGLPRCALLDWEAVPTLWPVVTLWFQALRPEQGVGASALGLPPWPGLEVRPDGVSIAGGGVAREFGTACEGETCSELAGRVGRDLDAVRALGYVLEARRPEAADSGVPIGCWSERQRSRIGGGAAGDREACAEPPRAAAGVPRDDVSLTALGPDVPTPPRLHVVIPLPELDADAVGAGRLLELMLARGGPLGRALAAPPLHVRHAYYRRHAAVGLATLSLDLPPRAAWRETRRGIGEILESGLPWIGPEALAAAGLSVESYAHLRALLRAALAPSRLTFVHVEGRGALASDPTGAAAERFARYVVAAASLRCPSPDDLRDASARLKELHGLSADTWRELAREVATDPDVAAGVEREVADRCGALAWLRQKLPARRLLALHEAWACRITPEPDMERRYRLVRALLERHGLDSAVLEPALEMGRLDPRLKARMDATEVRCPLTGDARRPPRTP